MVVSDDEFPSKEVSNSAAGEKPKEGKSQMTVSATSSEPNITHYTEHSMPADNSLLSTKKSTAAPADNTSALKDTLPVLTSDSGSSFPSVLASDHDNLSPLHKNTVSKTDLGHTELDDFTTSEGITMVDDSSKSLDAFPPVDNTSKLDDSGLRKRKFHGIHEENENIDPERNNKGSMKKTRSSTTAQAHSIAAKSRRSQRIGSKVSQQPIKTQRGSLRVPTGAATRIEPRKSPNVDSTQLESSTPMPLSVKDNVYQNQSTIDLTEEKHFKSVDIPQSQSICMELGPNAESSLQVSNTTPIARLPEIRASPVQHRVAFDPIVQYRPSSAHTALSTGNDLVVGLKSKAPVKTQPSNNRRGKEGLSLTNEPQMDDFVRVSI